MLDSALELRSGGYATSVLQMFVDLDTGDDDEVDAANAILDAVKLDG